jgi:hypothetical protein
VHVVPAGHVEAADDHHFDGRIIRRHGGRGEKQGGKSKDGRCAHR